MTIYNVHFGIIDDKKLPKSACHRIDHHLIDQVISKKYELRVIAWEHSCKSLIGKVWVCILISGRFRSIYLIYLKRDVFRNGIDNASTRDVNTKVFANNAPPTFP